MYSARLKRLTYHRVMKTSWDTVDKNELSFAFLQQRSQAVVLVEADTRLLHADEEIFLEE